MFGLWGAMFWASVGANSVQSEWEREVRRARRAKTIRNFIYGWLIIIAVVVILGKQIKNKEQLKPVGEWEVPATEQPQAAGRQ